MSNAWSRRFGGVPDADLDPLRVTDRVLDPMSYEDRDGYDPRFLDEAVPLPKLGVWADDAAKLFEEALFGDDPDPTELRYRHFSVKQSRSRRQPLFSAVNISGDVSRRGLERTDLWRRDSRIPLEAQVHRDSYGNASDGLFSRGHMTRREDPNWGSVETAKQADADTFHVTNACPQQQSFNSGLWLDLETYVLDNVVEEEIKASVITGAVFSDDDPVYKGVQVPIQFWKIVVYRHPELQRLAAIAYTRSQASFLPTQRRSRFVFGDFDDTQVSIRALQEDTGLDFSAYLALDVFADADPRMTVRLHTVEDAYLSP